MSKFLPGQSMLALKTTTGTRETTEITMPAVGSATQGDYVILYNAEGISKAIYIDIDSNGTEPTGALYTGADSTAALAYKNAVQETYVLTIPATAAATQADYVMVYDHLGNATAIWLDIDAAGTEPTGANYVASDAQVEVDIATGDTAAQAGTKFFNAVDGNIANVGFTDNLDGTITVLLATAGPAPTDAESLDADDSEAGSITVGEITKGVLATTDIAGGALLAAVSMTNASLTDVGDGTVTFESLYIGDATDAVPKDADDSGAGSITVSAVDGASSSFPYESPGDSPDARKVTPDLVS